MRPKQNPFSSESCRDGRDPRAEKIGITQKNYGIDVTPESKADQPSLPNQSGRDLGAGSEQ